MNDTTREPEDKAFAVLQTADPERERRHPWWQALVGASAAVAIVGGTGLGIGLSGIGAPASSAAYASGSLAESVAELGASGAKDDVIPYSYAGRYTYTAMGLSTEAGTANAYGFDPRSASNSETIGAVAAALGVEGAPQFMGGSWAVGAPGGSEPNIHVSLDGTLSFNYFNSAVQPLGCAENGACGEVPSEESALATLRDVVGKLGFDPSDFELAADASGGRHTTHTSANRFVEGKSTDQQIVVEVAEGGITYVSASLAPLVNLGEYSIVSEREAFTRLYDSRFGGSMAGYPGPVFDGVAAAEDWAPPTEPPPTPTPDAKVSWPVTTVQIISSSLALMSQWLPDGSVLLLPAYKFTDTNGGTWSVIAVDESHLDFSTD